MNMNCETSDRARKQGALRGLWALSAALLLAAPGAWAQAGDARAMLKAMSDYVGRQKTIELTFDSDIEVITPQMEKIQFTNSGGALLNRPNQLRAQRVGGYADVAMVFDGKTVSIVARHLNGYAQFEALRSGHGISMPFADLLMSNSYQALVADVMEAKHIGRGVIDGRECEHLAFRNFDTDWQLWVEVGDRPIPRKMVITSKTLNSAPQYTLRVKTWNTDVKPAPDAFVFVPPANAKRLDPQALAGLDELPPEAPTGAKK